jgi:hypothetical protein
MKKKYVGRRKHTVRRRVLKRVLRHGAEAMLAWIESGKPIGPEERADLALLLKELLGRGRQPGPGNLHQEIAAEMLSEIRMRLNAEKASRGHQRLPKRRREELAKAVHREWAARVEPPAPLPKLEYLLSRLAKGR